MEEPVFDVKLKRTGTRVPVVLSQPQTRQLFEKLTEPANVPKKTDGRYGLAARLQYGAGLRLSELVRLRVQDVDLERGTVTVRQGKGDKDCPRLRRRPAGCMAAPPRPWGRNGAKAPGRCCTVLPKSLREEIAEQIERARGVWRGDREAGLAGVHIRGAAARKFRRAAETFEWFWLFPAKQVSVDPEGRVPRRHHLLGSVYRVKGFAPRDGRSSARHGLLASRSG